MGNLTNLFSFCFLDHKIQRWTGLTVCWWLVPHCLFHKCNVGGIKRLAEKQVYNDSQDTPGVMPTSRPQNRQGRVNRHEALGSGGARVRSAHAWGGGGGAGARGGGGGGGGHSPRNHSQENSRAVAVFRPLAPPSGITAPHSH